MFRAFTRTNELQQLCDAPTLAKCETVAYSENMRARPDTSPSRPTLADVAIEAGVSRATAARALGDYGYVKASTRAVVIAVAQRIGYRPNTIARSMVTGRTQTIGFVSAHMENPFFVRTMAGLSDVARTSSYDVIIVNSQEKPELELSAVRVLQERQVDGLIVAPTQYSNGSHLRRLTECGVPVVLLDRSVRGLRADAVLIDNVKAARAATEKLIKLGHTRIGIITSDLGADPLTRLNETALDPTHGPTGAARGVGYLAALQGARLPVDADLIQNVQYSREGAAAATRNLLGLRERATAVLTVDNVLTLGAFEAIQSSGLDFPGQVSLLGFDDLEWTTIVRPTLSVVAQPAYDIGAAAARCLLARLKGEHSPAQVLFLDTALIERQSTAPAPEIALKPSAQEGFQA
jgi:LacI family transcriptional regulator